MIMTFLDLVVVGRKAHIYAYRGNTLYPVALRAEAYLDGFLDCKFVLTFAQAFVCCGQLGLFCSQTVAYSVSVLTISICTSNRRVLEKLG